MLFLPLSLYLYIYMYISIYCMYTCQSGIVFRNDFKCDSKKNEHGKNIEYIFFRKKQHPFLFG